MDDRESLFKIGKILDDYVAGDIKEIRALIRISNVLSDAGAWE